MAGCPSHQQADRDRPVQHARLQPGLAPGRPPLLRGERGQEEAPQLKHGEYFTEKNPCKCTQSIFGSPPPFE